MGPRNRTVVHARKYRTTIVTINREYEFIKDTCLHFRDEVLHDEKGAEVDEDASSSRTPILNFVCPFKSEVDPKLGLAGWIDVKYVCYRLFIEDLDFFRSKRYQSS